MCSISWPLDLSLKNKQSTPNQTKPNPNSRIFFGLLLLFCFVFPERFIVISDKPFELKDKIIPLLSKLRLNLMGLTPGQTQLFGMVNGSSNRQKAAFTLNLCYQGNYTLSSGEVNSNRKTKLLCSVSCVTALLEIWFWTPVPCHSPQKTANNYALIIHFSR